MANNYDELIQKAQGIQQRRATLQASIDSNTQQLQTIKQQLVSQYGENYKEKFDQAVAQIDEWEKANAAATV